MATFYSIMSCLKPGYDLELSRWILFMSITKWRSFLSPISTRQASYFFSPNTNSFRLSKKSSLVKKPCCSL